MKVSIYGAGYVGLVTGVCFAELGHDVCCFDVDQRKIDLLNQGKSPIYEEGLEPLLQAHQLRGRLHFTSDPDRAVSFSSLHFIAVGTPSRDDGHADLSALERVAEMIGDRITADVLVVNKSTVPVGTTALVKQHILSRLYTRQVKLSVEVASNPEFLKEGQALKDFMHPDRIVVGSSSQLAIQTLRELYAPLVDAGHAMLEMDERSAELTKYAANGFLATKISFMNEMARLAEELGADIESLKAGLALDTRIGKQFLNAGCGFGGSCFPKDVLALQAMAKEQSCELDILNSVLVTNERQKNLLYKRIFDFFNGDLSGRVIALWGLAFKPGTDDIRSASSCALMERLWEAGATVRAHDPLAMPNIARCYPEQALLTLCDTPESALESADILVVVTEWDCFRQPDFAGIQKALRYPVIFDGRNMYDPIALKQCGLRYYAIGRGFNEVPEPVLEAVSRVG